MELQFYTLDVFTEERFGGNPLAVVLDADALSDAQMQLVAREFALSETVFVMKAANPMHSARVRIFTPRSELPFAGHPTVGTAILLAELRDATGQGQRTALVVLEEEIGTVRVGVRLGSGAPFAEFDAPKVPERLGNGPEPGVLAAALGLGPSEIGFSNHRPSVYSAGLPFVFVPVRNLDVLRQASPNARYWGDAFADRGAAYVYTNQTQHTTSHFRARMFDPAHGIVEDPATGSAAAAFAGVIAELDALPDGMHRRVVEQGFEMGRPSLLRLEIGMTGRAVAHVRIGGHAVRVSAGRIEV